MKNLWNRHTQSDYVYNINSEPIKCVTKVVDLGVVVTNDLKWSKQIMNCTANANRMLGFLERNCTHTTDVHCRRLCDWTPVRSHFLYARDIWAPQGSSHDLALLKGVQRRATKYILHEFNSSYAERLKQLKLLPVSYWLELKVSFCSLSV